MRELAGINCSNNNFTFLVLMYMSKLLCQKIKSCGLLYYTEQTPETGVLGDNQNSREEVTNEPSSADFGTPSGGSEQPRISSQFKSRQK